MIQADAAFCSYGPCLYIRTAPHRILALLSLTLLDLDIFNLLIDMIPYHYPVVVRQMSDSPDYPSFYVLEQAVTDKVLGGGMLLVAGVVFTYYTIWALFLVSLTALSTQTRTCTGLPGPALTSCPPSVVLLGHSVDSMLTHSHSCHPTLP